MTEVRIPPGSVECRRGHSPKNAEEMNLLKRNAWHMGGVLMVDLNTANLNWDDRAYIEMVGTKLYGQRKGAKGTDHEKN